MKRRTINLIIVLSTIVIFAGMSYFLNLESQAQRQTLYWGSTGDQVVLLQRRLSQWGYYDGPISGVFGPRTSEAVRQFQRRNGLSVDGIVGTQTWAAIGYGTQTPAARATPTQAAPSVSNQDNIEMIARLIYGEARGEPYEGKVAVAAVLLNRVQSPEFPNSVAGVIYQPLAFEVVANGQFYQRPDEEAYRAARAALNGWDPTYGALFFWNPYKPVNPWIWSRQIVRQIGDHVFAY